MKRIVLMLIMAISLGSLSAQECTLRLEMPATPPNPGEDFFVGMYMDVLLYPGYDSNAVNGFLPTLKSGQIGITFDPAVLVALETDPLPFPPFSTFWYHNLHGMFSGYNADPAANLPNPGDLRFVSYTTMLQGMDPDYYGFVSGSAPLLMWELKFNYIGGDIAISFQDADKMTAVEPNLSGGVKEKIVTFWTAWDDAAYAMTYENIGGGAVTNDWTGANGDVWNDPLNWSLLTVPGPADDVTIDATTKAAPVISGSAVTGTLHLIAGQLSIAPGGDLTTNGLFTNDGVLYMSNLVGVSASYMDMAGLAGVGTFLYDRDVFCSGVVPNPVTTFGWHYISSPIAGFTTDDLPDYFVNAWDETNLTFPWMHYAYDPYVNPCTPWPTTPMNPLDAWSINFDLTYPSPSCPGLAPGTGNVVEFTGPFTALNTGGHTAPATVSGGAFSGWNFYGNPYASSIDPALFNWTGFANATAQEGVAIWEEDCIAGNYIYSNSTLGYPHRVGPTQGFFVKALTAGTFALAGTERVHDNGQTIYKDDITNLLTLEATRDGISDETYIRFMEEMEPGMDVGDFPKMFSTSEGLAQIYTTAQGEQLAINALPATPVVPMGFTSVTTGEYTISAIETSEFADVVLEDLVTGEQTDLLINSYTFNYTVNDDADRFLVHFTPLGIGDNLANSIDIWSNDHKIYVQAPEINGGIVVFNMMGQEVIRTEIEPGLNIIPVNDRNSYYVVKVVSSDVARTGKVYVK